MLNGRPLYDSLADRRYFVVPSAWDPLVRATGQGLNVLLAGERGSGKTTLLRRLQASLREQGATVAFAEAGDVGSAFALATRVRDALGAPAGAAPGGETTEAFYALLEQIGASEAATVVVDASGSAAAVYELFGRFRDSLWRMPHRWVVAVDRHERDLALKPPADAFFDAVLELEPMPVEALTELLRLREPDAPAASLANVAAGADGNPRLAIRALGDAAVHGREPGNGQSEREDLLERAGRLGSTHRLVMAELIDRGEASPSDAGLQTAVGVSRARLTQVLRDLFEHRLVSATQNRASGPGRPRTVYRPRERRSGAA